MARYFKVAGADMIDVFSGEVDKRQQSGYDRMPQVSLSDRLRKEASIAAMTLGAFLHADPINSVIAAGRADFCALVRSINNVGDRKDGSCRAARS